MTFQNQIKPTALDADSAARLLKETPGRRAARQAKGPTNSEFDTSKWRALAESGNLDEHDLRLLVSGIWIAAESAALRKAPGAVDHAGVGGGLSTMLAVAALNHDMQTAAEIRARAFAESDAESDGIIQDFDEMAARPLPSEDSPHGPSLHDLLDAAGDAVDSWLYDASNAPTTGDHETCATAGTLGRIASDCLRRYSHQRGLHRLWQEAAWESWRLEVDRDGTMFWEPVDPALALTFGAWLARNRANAMNYPHIDAAAWTLAGPERRRDWQLARTAVRIERRSGGGRRIVVGRPPCGDVAPFYVLAKGALEGSYLIDFLDRDFPNAPGLNCSLLLRAWHVVKDLADLLAQDSMEQEFESVKSVGRAALVVNRSDLEKTLHDALGCTKSVAISLTEFLTWRPDVKGAPKTKGLWGAPIVTVPGSARICLARPILTGTNVVRCAEIWMQKGGLDDNLSKNARGDSYEFGLREDLRQAVETNPLLTDARVAPRAVKSSKSFGEQIDLLIQIGNLLVVGEVKCLLFPTDPSERFSHIEKLAGAAKQANRKAQAIAARRDVASQALGIAEQRANALRVVPLVVVNQGFGLSMEIDGCRIVDAHFLKIYLGSGSYSSSMVRRPETGSYVSIHDTLYANQAEAVAQFETTLCDPPVLRCFIDRLHWSSFPFPTASKDQLWCRGTVLGDIGAEERSRAEYVATAAGLAKPAA